MSGKVGEASRKPGIADVWLEKYSVYRQDPQGEPVNVDFMLLNEVEPARVDLEISQLVANAGYVTALAACATLFLGCALLVTLGRGIIVSRAS